MVPFSSVFIVDFEQVMLAGKRLMSLSYRNQWIKLQSKSNFI